MKLLWFTVSRMGELINYPAKLESLLRDLLLLSTCPSVENVAAASALLRSSFFVTKW